MTTASLPPISDLRPGRPAPSKASDHTVWGMDPVQLHARFWASRGIQVVHQGVPSEIVPHAELFLLADPRTLALFRLNEIVEQLSWLDSEVALVRLVDNRDKGYRELALTDARGKFQGFRREYGGDSRLARVALTPIRDIARLWQAAPSAREGWQKLRRSIPQRERWTMSVQGRVYDRQLDEEAAAFVRDLIDTWHEPGSTIPGIRRVRPRVWAPEGFTPQPDAKFHGALWIGAGRQLPPASTPIGPAVLWDRPENRPVPQDIEWLELQPSAQPTFRPPRAKTRGWLGVKRAIDIVLSAGALLATLPLYPIIAAAIYLEDPGPIFFVHTRETKGGREFGCIKFRSMRVNSEQMKQQLQAQNKADGPQFYIPNDPRVTRVGALLRKLQLDEIPQFINVLRGDMSMVGPRPSPYKENQFCPPWREARLSVKPGITGLWQVKRTRATGSDFQEWIKYDIEYVERQSLWLDFWIMWKTIMLIIKGVTRS